MRKIWIHIIAACVLSGLIGMGQAVVAGQETGGAPPTAQQAHPPRGRVERELQRMRETLNLTDDQVAKIRPILQTRNKQLKDLRADSSCRKERRGQKPPRFAGPPAVKWIRS